MKGKLIYILFIFALLGLSFFALRAGLTSAFDSIGTALSI